MVTDRIERLPSYTALDAGLTGLRNVEKEEMHPFNGYAVDRDHTVVITVEDGRFLVSTTWRENPLSREASAVVTLEKGMFALFLPGEPYAVKDEDGNGSASMYVLR